MWGGAVGSRVKTIQFFLKIDYVHGRTRPKKAYIQLREKIEYRLQSSYKYLFNFQIKLNNIGRRTYCPLNTQIPTFPDRMLYRLPRHPDRSLPRELSRKQSGAAEPWRRAAAIAWLEAEEAEKKAFLLSEVAAAASAPFAVAVAAASAVAAAAAAAATAKAKVSEFKASYATWQKHNEMESIEREARRRIEAAAFEAAVQRRMAELSPQMRP